MSNPSKFRASLSRRTFFISTIVLMNVALLALTLVFSATPRLAMAQDENKPDATPQPGGVRFDTYPNPQSRGALAYTLGDRWDHTDLTYYYDNCPRNINCNTAHQAVDAAFQSWAEVSTLTFQEVGSASQADIELLWTVDSPELGYVGDVLAFTTFPSDGGDVYFDDAEPWSAFDGGSFDLYLVAAHELGHAFGLDHSSVPTALMYPVLTPNTTGITDDDAAGIQALYGRPQAQPQEDIPQAPDTEATSVSGEISEDYPFEEWEFDAFAGETLTITMTATSGDLDPYLGLLTNDEETVLAESGPAYGGVAEIVYTFDQDGTYVAVASRDGFDEGSTTGSYDLTLTSGDQSQQTGGSVPSDDQGNDTLVYADIWSYTVMDICEAYISPTTSDEWGANLLDTTLTNGNVFENEVPPDTYDILIVGCDGTEIEQYEIDIHDDSAIEVYDGELNVYVYAD